MDINVIPSCEQCQKIKASVIYPTSYSDKIKTFKGQNNI